MTTNDNTNQAEQPAAAQERRSLDELDLSPQGPADAPAKKTDPDSLVYAGNS
jgi:hypothetical protein